MPELDYDKMSDYEKMRFKRIARNEAYLEGLGLGKNGKSNPKMQEAIKTTKSRKHKTRKSTPKHSVLPGEERRSSRVKKDTSDLVELSNEWDETKGSFRQAVSGQDEDEEGDVTYYQRTTVRSSTVNIDVEEYTLTDEDKEKLKATCDENYLNKLAEFLTHHNACSPANVRTVMRQAKLLYDGDGVFYKWWPEKNSIFMKGVRITPLTDIVQVLLDAKAWENKYGSDKGNGWLLQHPLKKMLIFQQFCLNNPEFMTSDLKIGAWLEEDDAESAEEDNEEDIENRPVYQSQRADVEGNLTTLLENVGTDVSAAVSPSKASRKSPSKSPRKSPAKKSKNTPIKSPKKGELLPSFVVKQKNPEKKSARELLKEKVAAKKAAKSTEVSTPAVKKVTPPAKKASKSVVKKVTPPAKKASTTTPKKKSVKEQLAAKAAAKKASTSTPVGSFTSNQKVEVDWAGEMYDAKIQVYYPIGKGQHNVVESYDVVFEVDGTVGEVEGSFIKKAQ